MNSPADICGTIACLKLSAHVFPGMNFIVFDLNQDLNISKGVFFDYYQGSLTDCVWPCFNCSEPKHRNSQLHNATAGTNTVLPLNLYKFLREHYKYHQGCWRHPVPNLLEASVPSSVRCPYVRLQRVCADVQCVQSIAAVLSHQSQSFPAFSVFLGV